MTQSKLDKLVVNVLKERYLWVHKRIGDYRIQINNLGNPSFENEPIALNQIISMLRNDYVLAFPGTKSKQLNFEIKAILVHLISLALKEMSNLKDGHYEA